MRATIRRAVEAHKAQREENGQAGFSLIELIVVVVILGILIAIAIPIFLSIQDTAEQNAVKTAAANGATMAAAEIARDGSATGLDFSSLKKGQVTDVAITKGEASLTTLCVTAKGYTTSNGGAGWTYTAGPGADAAGTGCTP